MNTRFTQLLGDYPIQDPKDDFLDRKEIAEHFVKTILNLERSQGVVTSVLGPWGSGKTSFINMVVAQLRKQEYEVLEFNPWMFHGTEQLVRNFFDEISAQMTSSEKDINLVQIGNLLRKYGVGTMLIRDISSRTLAHLNSSSKFQVTLAKIIPFFERKVTQRISESSREFRMQIENAFQERNRPIIVVIDDIDRLTASEIRDIFQLVRLTASFPNLIYIVSFDRAPIEKALETPGVSGHDYMEKIIQFPFDLPKLSKIQIDRQTTIALEQVLGVSASPSLFNMPAWLDIYYDIILPLIRNIRDIRRYAIATQQALIKLDKQIEQVDILALEAIRLFLPNVFKLLPEAIYALTMPPINQHSRNRYENLSRTDTLDETKLHTLKQAQRQKLIGAGKHQGEVVKSMLLNLFPEIQGHKQESVELLQTRRVAHENILRLYLEQTADPGLLVFNDAQQALNAMGNETAFEGFWHEQDPKRWWDIIHYLEGFENEFLPEQVIPGTTVMLNLLPNMPVLPQHPYHINRLTVIRVVLRLFRKLEDATVIENSMREILTKVHSLSSKMALIEHVSYASETQNKFIPKVAVKDFKEFLCEQIRSASSDDIAEEYESARLVHFVKFECEQSSHLYTIEDSPKLTYSLLRSSQNQASGMPPWYDGVPESRISWDFLSKLYGDEKMLIACIMTLDVEFENLIPWFKQHGIPLDEARQTLALARKYVQRDPEISR